MALVAPALLTPRGSCWVALSRREEELRAGLEAQEGKGKPRKVIHLLCFVCFCALFCVLVRLAGRPVAHGEHVRVVGGGDRFLARGARMLITGGGGSVNTQHGSSDRTRVLYNVFELFLVD